MFFVFFFQGIFFHGLNFIPSLMTGLSHCVDLSIKFVVGGTTIAIENYSIGLQ